MAKVSIIIPVFNAEETIKDTLESVLNQSLKDIEIIVVNDCSTDGTSIFLSDVANVDCRVKLITLEVNSSASIARKVGIKAASGQYIMFLDADDQFDQFACELAYKEMQSTGVDVVHFGTKIIGAGATADQLAWFERFVNKHPEGSLVGNLVKKCFGANLFGFSIWNKVYKTSLVKAAASNLPEQAVFKAQDLLLQFLIMFFSVSYSYLNKTLYRYSYGTGITGGQSFTREKIDTHMRQSDVLRVLWSFLYKRNLHLIYSSEIQEIAKILISDNLVTVKDCHGQEFKEYSKEQFSLNWFENNCQLEGEGAEELYRGFMEVVFEGFRVDTVFCSLYNKFINQRLVSLQSKSLSDMREKLANGVSNIIPVVMAVNEKYLPYLAVAVESIKQNNVSSLVYIYIFYTDISDASIERVKALSGANVIVDCINVNPYINKSELYSKAHYSVEMYYRLIIAEIFYFVPKVLYLDCDIVVLADLSEVYNVNMDGYIMGVARNPINIWMRDYLVDKLNFPNEKYFNSGVLLINTGEFISHDIKNKSLDFLRENLSLACPDQDALNVTCLGKVKFIGQKWNYQWHHNISIGDKPLTAPLLDIDKLEYSLAESEKKIIHYTSNIKPWNSPSQRLSGIFWSYAKDSPFFYDVVCANVKI